MGMDKGHKLELPAKLISLDMERNHGPKTITERITAIPKGVNVFTIFMKPPSRHIDMNRKMMVARPT
jgi:hypothetical protein